VSVIARPAFKRYVGIDYFGAETPESSLKGLSVYVADHGSEPVELQPPPSPRKYWTRRGVAQWIVESVPEWEATLIGIDHAFSFPKQYFDTHRLPPDWPAFLEDLDVTGRPTRNIPTSTSFVTACAAMVMPGGATRAGVV
jgi:hypothetical protein